MLITPTSAQGHDSAAHTAVNCQEACARVINKAVRSDMSVSYGMAGRVMCNEVKLIYCHAVGIINPELGVKKKREGERDDY